MSDLNTQVCSAVDGLTREFDIIANNLANLNTAGYKKQCNTFSKLLTAQESQIGLGTDGEVQLDSAYDFSQGNFIETGGTLDFALYGSGFFVVETTQGPLYTRNGSFQLNQNNQIVDSSGRIVSGESGPITIPSDITLSQLTVSSDGTISANGNTIGKFKLVDFKDQKNTLTAAGLNCYSASSNTQAQEATNTIVKQGYQEGSNVQMVEELVDMITVSRLYEANMKFLEVGSENSKNLINVAMG